MALFDLKEGKSPLIISVPHAGSDIPDEIQVFFNKNAQNMPDTDWYIDRLYRDLVETRDATLIKANYSRYLIDLNRPPNNKPLYPGQAVISLCPTDTFDGDPLYQAGYEPGDDEIAARRETYWQPYHEALAAQIERVKAEHGYALVYDAHSIRSEVPRLFEGRLPDLNIGTNHDKSCAPALAQAIIDKADESPYSAVLNGRFVGGYITRHHGDPENGVHAVQMELAQSTYMNEESPYEFNREQAEKLRPVLGAVLDSMLEWGRHTYSPPRTTPEQGLKPNL